MTFKPKINDENSLIWPFFNNLMSIKNTNDFRCCFNYIQNFTYILLS